MSSNYSTQFQRYHYQFLIDLINLIDLNNAQKTMINVGIVYWYWDFFRSIRN